MRTIDVDVAIVGGGAAGMAAGIFCAEAMEGGAAGRIVILEGARKPGAKILVSGGGRCNVTNRDVTAGDFNGSSKAVIRRVLKSFGNRHTLQWMEELGVELKLEETGKYFPASDSAKTVLSALRSRLSELGVDFRTGCRVRSLSREEGRFLIHHGEGGTIRARRVILATGGLSLPKSGSDGAGLQWMREWGFQVNPVTPALAPLLFRVGDPIGDGLRGLSGMTFPARLSLHEPSGRKLTETEGSLLLTHFGLSGPAAMDLSRHFSQWALAHPGELPVVRLGAPSLPHAEAADKWILAEVARSPTRQVSTALETLLPSRLASFLAPAETRLGDLTRPARLGLARDISGLPLPVSGDRGYPFAETTAGGVDLSEINPATMEARRVPGLFLCGEILDADGRIGGFNFQWAWATGWLAGRGAARAGE